MYCPNCGIENAVDAEACVSCGHDLRTQAARDSGHDLTPRPGPPPPAPYGQPAQQQPVYAAYPYDPARKIPNYLPQAITLTVIGLCCWMLPSAAGIPAIVFASQVNTKLQVGDVTGAMDASRNARIWCWISFGLVIAIGSLQLSIFAIPFLAMGA